MVSKKNFSNNGRTFPYKKFKAGGGQFNNQMFFNASQIPENPDYMDFNNIDNFNLPNTHNAAANNINDVNAVKRKNQKNKQKNKQNPQQHSSGQQNGAWAKNKVPQQYQQQQQQFGPSMGPNNKFRNQQRGFHSGNGNSMPMRGAMGNSVRGRMMPPMNGGMGPRRPPHGFQRPPMMPPIPPPHMGPMRPPMPIVGMLANTPPFLRRNGRRPPPGIADISPFKKPMFPVQMPPPINLPMPPMMPPGPLPHMPLPYNNNMGPNAGKIKKPNPKMVKKIVKSKSTIKTLKNLQNQYPLDKPWITEEIRNEHGKKVEIEDKLKGKKDDELFAQFKTQRDKFVALYEKAREEYLKKEAAQVKTKVIT